MAECIFCKIARKEVPTRIVHEDPLVVAFDDINPQAPTHTLVIPRKHIATLNDVGAGDEPLLGRMLAVAAQVAKNRGHESAGYRVVANCMEGAGQSVFHIHVHLLGGRRFAWPPG
jgi:histidine triad (HIT) family protein